MFSHIGFCFFLFLNVFLLRLKTLESRQQRCLHPNSLCRISKHACIFNETVSCFNADTCHSFQRFPRLEHIIGQACRMVF